MHEVTQVPNVHAFIKEMIAEQQNRGTITLYRGQPVDAHLVSKIARPWKNSAAWRKTVLHREQHQFRNFARQSIPFVSQALASDGDVLAYAQHNSLATRLLDWTTNPLAAAFFSVEDERSFEEAVVWRLEVQEEDIVRADEANDFDFFKTKRSMVYEPNHNCPRIRAQSGWFTVQAITESICQPLNLGTRFKDRLKKYVFTTNRDTIMRELNWLGMNRAVLFPDPDGLAKHLEWEATESIPYREVLIGRRAKGLNL